MSPEFNMQDHLARRMSEVRAERRPCVICGIPDAAHAALFMADARTIASIGQDPGDGLVAVKFCCDCVMLPRLQQRTLQMLAAKRAAAN
jgi:hypothetical protein